MCVHCNWRVARRPGHSCVMCYEYFPSKTQKSTKLPMLPPFNAQPLSPPPLPPPLEPPTFPTCVEYTRDVEQLHELQHNDTFLHVKWIGQNHLQFVIRVQCMWRIWLAVRKRNHYVDVFRRVTICQKTIRRRLACSRLLAKSRAVTKCQCAIRRYFARCRVLAKIRGVTNIQNAIRCYLARRRLLAKISVRGC